MHILKVDKFATKRLYKFREALGGHAGSWTEGVGNDTVINFSARINRCQNSSFYKI